MKQTYFVTNAGRIKHLLSHHLIAILLIITASAVVRFVGIAQKQLWTDEIIQVLHSNPISIREILSGVAEDKGGAPLDYIVQHYSMKVLGGSIEFAARFHAAVFGCVSVILIYALSIILLHNKRMAVFSSFLYALFPYHVHYSQEGRPYSLFLLLILILSLIYFSSRRKCLWISISGMSLCSAAGLYTNPFTATFIVTLVAVNIIRAFQGKLNKYSFEFLMPIISGAFAACLFAPWLAYSFRNTQADFSNSLSLHLIPEAIQGLGDGSYAVSLLLLSLAALGVAVLRRENPDVLIDLSCWIIIPIPLILAILYWRSYFFSSRQLIFITPAIIVLAACGIEHLWCEHGRKTLIILIGYAFVCILVIGMHFPDKRTDLRGVGAYLKRSLKAGDIVYAPNTLGLLSFYFPEIYSYKVFDISHIMQPVNRLYTVDKQYARAVKNDSLMNIDKRMRLYKRLVYRGITISIYSCQCIP
jgi:uncharacterized membrane protein